MWTSVKEKLPKHGQHVLVWNNVDTHPFPKDCPGDDGKGGKRICDAIFVDMKIIIKEYHSDETFNNAFEKYLKEGKNGNERYQWRGGRSLDRVSHWMKIPLPPEDFLKNPDDPMFSDGYTRTSLSDSLVQDLRDSLKDFREDKSVLGMLTKEINE